MISLPSLMSALNEAPEDIFNTQDHCLRPEGLIFPSSLIQTEHSTRIPQLTPKMPESVIRICEGVPEEEISLGVHKGASRSERVAKRFHRDYLGHGVCKTEDAKQLEHSWYQTHRYFAAEGLMPRVSVDPTAAVRG